mmetsp:Transcript_34294/g.74067  ORF Transcript_34294/g.74067 Transcript_34294/m.74067 type:complete len:200 (-) Transcript_34294:8-607(-)
MQRSNSASSSGETKFLQYRRPFGTWRRPHKRSPYVTTGTVQRCDEVQEEVLSNGDVCCTPENAADASAAGASAASTPAVPEEEEEEEEDDAAVSESETLACHRQEEDRFCLVAVLQEMAELQLVPGDFVNRGLRWWRDGGSNGGVAGEGDKGLGISVLGCGENWKAEKRHAISSFNLCRQQRRRLPQARLTLLADHHIL